MLNKKGGGEGTDVAFPYPQKVTLHQRIIQQLQSDSKISENINVSLEKMSDKEEANEARRISKDNLLDNLSI